MDPLRMAMAVGVAGGTVVALVLAAALLFRRASPHRQAAMTSPILLVAFMVAYAVVFNFPDKLPPELWQSPIHVAMVAGVMGALASFFARRWWVYPILLVMVGGGSLSVFSNKMPDYWHYALFLAGGQLALLLALGPLARRRAPATTVPLAFLIASTAATVGITYAVDQRLGGTLALVCALLGAAGLMGLFGFTSRFARGALGFGALMLPAVCAAGAYYNFSPVPAVVFAMFPVGALGAAVAYVPALQRRKWWCLGVVGVVAVVLEVPAVILTIMNAPPV